MAIFNFLFDVICLSILFSLEIKAATLTLKSSEPETTYLEYGRTLNLNVSYQYDGNQAVSVTWSLNGADKIRVSDDGSVLFNHDPLRAKIIGQASLQLMNTNFSDNGTFRVTAYAGDASDIVPLDFKVIIQEQPTAVIRCSPLIPIVNEGEDITCLCSATGGNPPATASWSKNGMMINGTGYLEKNLTLKNIGAKDAGTYKCTVRSHNLNDTKSIEIKVNYEPRNISFSSNEPNNNVTSGDTVKITCKADAFPKASYNISVNGSQPLTGVVNGVYTINSVNDSHAGNYTCVAKNSLGNVSAHFVLTVRARPTPTPTPTQIMPTRTSNQSASTSTSVPVIKTTGAPPGDKEESNIAPIVGGAIGGVVFLIICIVLIWYCCCKRSASGSCKGGDGGEEDIVANPANPSYAAMGDSMDRGNPYESVDQAKIDEARAADEAGPSNENPPDAGNSLPPVYAVVNKSKKTPKPPPEKQPDSLTYASLDPVVLQPDSSKMRDRTREETNYASIDLEKLKKDQE